MTEYTIKKSSLIFQLEYMALMRNCGRRDRYNECLLKVREQLTELIGVDVLSLLMPEEIGLAQEEENLDHAVKKWNARKEIA
jgi:hypothetical protein